MSLINRSLTAEYAKMNQTSSLNRIGTMERDTYQIVVKTYGHSPTPTEH